MARHLHRKFQVSMVARLAYLWSRPSSVRHLSRTSSFGIYYQHHQINATVNSSAYLFRNNHQDNNSHATNTVLSTALAGPSIHCSHCLAPGSLACHRLHRMAFIGHVVAHGPTTFDILDQAPARMEPATHPYKLYSVQLPCSPGFANGFLTSTTRCWER